MCQLNGCCPKNKEACRFIVLHQILRTVSKKTLSRKILSFKRSGAASAVSLRFSAEYVHVVVLWVKCFGRVHIFFLT